MTEVTCPGLPGAWINAWLAAVGATVLDARVRLQEVAIRNASAGRLGVSRSTVTASTRSWMPGTLILDSNLECPDTPIWADLAVRGVTMPIGPMNPGLAKGAAGV